ncbi:MAG: succinate--CoA ligase subunit alpha [Dehalococcoidia bacterium]|nr:succinate--CoA ligase subunit alpha [Dehalococcoidia bacterium]MDH5781100.1 succinate--CoA ligase subunit alpha [Dehalococcoidia bacterium]
MSIIIDENTKVIVQGITGREGSLRSRYMKGYGTKVVAGTSPGRGGEEVDGIPVYNTVKEAVRTQGKIDMSVTFIPGPGLKTAVLEAIDSGVKYIVAPVERVPLHDIMEMVSVASKSGVMIIGPGSIGIMSPGKAVAGWLGGNVQWANKLFQSGPIGVLSRSGGESGTVPWVLKNGGLGVSTAIHTGTEPILGVSFADLLLQFEKDEQTLAVAAFGEIGGSQEEEAAEVIKAGKVTKPFVIYIAGTAAPEGQRFSHASAIVERGRGSVQGKVKALREAGAYPVETPKEIVPTLKKLLKL